MWNREFESCEQPVPQTFSRRTVIKAGLFVGASLLFPRNVQAEEWVYAANAESLWQDPQWFPFRPEVAVRSGLHTLYEPNGPLAVYDERSAQEGCPTNFRQENEDFAKGYLYKYRNLSPVFLDTTGYCHGVANASVYGEQEPVGDWFTPKYIKVGLLAALHSGDSLYMPAVEQLMEILISTGNSFVVETKGAAGFWSREALAINTRRTMILATDFGRSPKVIQLDQIKDAYIPVPNWKEQDYPAGQLTATPKEWKIGLNRDLVYDIVYNRQ